MRTNKKLKEKIDDVTALRWLLSTTKEKEATALEELKEMIPPDVTELDGYESHLTITEVTTKKVKEKALLTMILDEADAEGIFSDEFKSRIVDALTPIVSFPLENLRKYLSPKQIDRVTVDGKTQKRFSFKFNNREE